MKLYVIVTLLVILLIILSYNTYYENFVSLPRPKTEDSPVRVDFSCADNDQKNIFDRFNFAQRTDINNRCPPNYAKINNYFGLSNLCLPNCPSGYFESSIDMTLCVANSCRNTPDLSANIQGSWYNTCSVLYQQQYRLTSTITSISNVMRSINTQTNIVDTEYTDLNNTLNNFDCLFPVGANIRRCNAIDQNKRNIDSNYNSIMNIRNNVNLNYNFLTNQKNRYDAVYYDLLCDRYV